jgi:hypothetical protein
VPYGTYETILGKDPHGIISFLLSVIWACVSLIIRAFGTQVTAVITNLILHIEQILNHVEVLLAISVPGK